MVPIKIKMKVLEKKLIEYFIEQLMFKEWKMFNNVTF